MPTRGIPYPTGDPALGAEEERRLRRQLIERALEALSTPVDGPTVFAVSAIAVDSGADTAESASPGSAARKVPGP